MSSSRCVRRGSIVALLLLATAGCTSQHDRLRQHQQKMQSLAATTRVVCESWLAGDVSGRYASTALRQTLQLLEQERAALVAAPKLLRTPDGARLSDAADSLERRLARLMDAVAQRDAASVRESVAKMPLLPAEDR